MKGREIKYNEFMMYPPLCLIFDAAGILFSCQDDVGLIGGKNTIGPRSRRRSHTVLLRFERNKIEGCFLGRTACIRVISS